MIPKPLSYSTHIISLAAAFVLAFFVSYCEGIAAVHAEELTKDTTSPKTEKVIAKRDVSKATSKRTKEPIQPDQVTTVAPVGVASVSTEEISILRQTPGRIAGSVPQIGTEGNTGALTYTYPLFVPPAHGKVVPALTLGYNSQLTTDVSPFGYGWSISIPYIERMQRGGIDTLYSTTAPAFTSSISGELVTVGSSTVNYQARTDTGAFLQYRFENNAWIVTDKEGTQYHFGETRGARMDDGAATSSRTYRWMLERALDRNGNYTLYTYTKHENQLYPERISFTHASSAPATYAYTFARTAVDPYFTYQTGFRVARHFVISRISLLVNNVPSRTYTLRYIAGVNDTRRLLAGVTETGIRDGIETALPETTFTYGGSELPTWQTESVYNFPEPLASQDIGTRLGDINGDGLIDVVRYQDFNDRDDGAHDIVQRVHINKGDGTWDMNVPWDWSDIQVPFVFRQDGIISSITSSHDLGTKLIDMNGDGRDDIVVGWGCAHNFTHVTCDPPPGFPSYQKGVYLNTGSGFVKAESWDAPVFMQWYRTDDYRGYFSDSAQTLLDVNADGLPDIVYAAYDSYTQPSPSLNTGSSIVLNTGAGWKESSLKFPVGLAGIVDNKGTRNLWDSGVRFGDVNADGLIDVLHGYQSTTQGISGQTTYIHTGVGWATTTALFGAPPAFVIDNTASPNRGYDVVDINADGLVDIIKSYRDTVDSDDNISTLLLNQGNGWEERSYTFPFFLTEGSRGAPTGMAFTDFTGDTVTDVLSLRYGDTFPIQSSGGDLIKNTSGIPDLLVSIETPYGGTSAITYDGYLDIAQGTYSSMGKPARNPVIVSKITHDAGRGTPWSETYAYTNGAFYYNPNALFDRRFTGFETITRTTSLGSTVMYYHQGNGVNSSTNEGVDSFARIGLPYRSEIKSTTGTLFNRVDTQWGEATSTGGRTFVFKTRDYTQEYDGNATTRDTATGYTYNFLTGNITTMTEWGEVSKSGTSTFRDIGTDRRDTTYTYTNPTLVPDGLSLLSQESLVNQSRSLVRQKQFFYDDLPFGQARKGNQTSVREYSTTSMFREGRTRYNPTGLPVMMIDARGNTTTISYDASLTCPQETVNPLGQRTARVCDLATGQVTQTIDPNGAIRETTFDGLGRPLKIFQSRESGPGTELVTEYRYAATEPNRTHTKHYSDDTTDREVYSYVDGFGRPTQVRSELPKANQYAVVDTIYGTNGLVVAQSIPYERSGVGYSATLPPDEFVTNSTYDALGRIRTQRTVLGTTSFVYDNWIQMITDPEGKRRDVTFDAYKRPTVVTERLGASAFNTRYSWNHNNKLMSVTDATSNYRNFQYDLLGRRTQAEDLRKGNDPTFGVWRYQYDAQDNVVRVVDAEGATTTYTYDALNRRTSEDVLGRNGIEAVWSYDTCGNGIGRLCSATNDASVLTYVYTPLGRIQEVTTTLPDVDRSYTLAYTYTRQGSPQRIVYPDDTEIRYSMDTAGNPVRVDRLRDGTREPIITNVKYGVHGGVMRIDYGNGVVSQRLYDPLALYRLVSLTTIATTTFGTGGPGEVVNLLEAALLATAPQPDTTQNAGSEISNVTSQTSTLVTDVITKPEVIPLGSMVEVIVPPEQQLSTSTTTPTIPVPKTTPVEVLVSGLSVSTTTDILAPTTTDIFVTVPVELFVGTSSLATGTVDSATTTPLQEFGVSTTTATATLSEVPPEPFIHNARVAVLLKEADHHDHAQIKAHAVAQGVRPGMFVLPGSQLRIEIVALEEIPDGVQVFVRAWQQRAQLGFGEDGSVDIEKIRIINPPILVWRGTELYEDVESALLEALEATIDTVGKEDAKIEQGKIGQTTTVIYPHEGLGNVTTDGGLFEDRFLSWTTTITLDSPRIVRPYNMTSDITSAMGNGNGSWHYSNGRIHFGFDTTQITNDVEITSASLKLRAYAHHEELSGQNRRFHIVAHASADSSDLRPSDYGRVGTTSLGVSDNNWILDAYNTIPLNDAGVAYITRGGVTNFMTRTWYDLEGVAPDNNNEMSLIVYLADNPGSSQDPMLVIEHRPDLIDPETVPEHFVLQDLRYTYDRVGNITRIVDGVAQGGVSTTTYSYDDLYRLRVASTTGSTTMPYKHSYTYNNIGNLLSGPAGSYTYSTTSFANPHAPTTIGAVTYNYDKNGNLVSTSAGLINTWNYRNRLVRTESPSTSPVTYAYDTNDQRVTKIQGSNRTDYIGSLYEVTPEGTTKNIYLGDLLVATIEDTGTTTKTLYHHHDHLSSTRVSTNKQGTPTYTTDYYPYGSPRTTIETDTPSRQYIGQIRDEETTWNYLNARYYDSARGQFLSQDPVFWEIGQTEDGKRLLHDPQLANSYSYARNNPILHKDPNGRIIPLLAGAWAAVEFTLSASDGYNAYKTVTDSNASFLEKSVSVLGFAVGTVAPGAGYGKVGNMAAKNGDELVEGTTKASQISDVLLLTQKSSVLTDAELSVGYHTAKRMVERNINLSMIEDTVKSGEKFTYFHEGVNKTGYYDPNSKVFLGSVDGKITTAINNVDQKYINNLKSKK